MWLWKVLPWHLRQQLFFQHRREELLLQIHRAQMIQKLFAGNRVIPNLFELTQLREHRHRHSLHNLLRANPVLIIVALVVHALMDEPQCFDHQFFDQLKVEFFCFEEFLLVLEDLRNVKLVRALDLYLNLNDRSDP